MILGAALVALPSLSSQALAATQAKDTGVEAGALEKAQAQSRAPSAAKNDPSKSSGEAKQEAAETAGESSAGGTNKAQEKAQEQADKSGSEEEKDSTEASPYSSEAMALWPDVDSFVTSRFGERRGSTVPLLSDAPMRPRFHSGLDVRGHLGWPVRTLKSGTVLLAGMAGSAGLTVKIAQTDGKTVSYAHLGKVLVKKGDKVKQGQHIGEVGCTGRTSGAHVHITVRNSKGQRTDPRKEIGGLWELYDPPLEDLKTPLQAQACVRRGYNKRLAGQKQYLRMRKALLESGAYKIPDIEPWKN